MRYKAKRGIGVPVKVAGAEINRLIKLRGDSITPAQIVKAAKKKSSPIHNCFTWNDTEAAKKCRLLEARYLLRMVTVVYEENKKTYTTRAFVTTNDRQYRTIESVLSDDELREELLEQAKADLKAFRDKYRQLNELAAIFEAIDKL
jgi:hypothetical protein